MTKKSKGYSRYTIFVATMCLTDLNNVVLENIMSLDLLNLDK